MQFLVADRVAIESGIVVRTSYVVISITDPGSSFPTIPKTAGLRDILHVQFHDAEPLAELPLPRNVVVMTLEHAHAIWDFVHRYQNRVGAIVTHCEQGASRSPAVAAAICKYLGRDPSHFFRDYTPNRHVFDLLLATAAVSPPARSDNQLEREGRES